MSEYLKKITKRLLVSVLIASMILSQTVPAIVSAETTITNTELQEKFAKEMGIEIKEKTKKTEDKSSIEFLIKDATSNMPSIRNNKIYTMGVPASYGKGKIYGGYHLTSPYAFNIENKSIYSGYSRDGRLYTTGTKVGSEYVNGEQVQKPNLDMKWYPTAKYFSEQHSELKDTLDIYFGEENLFRIPSIVPNGTNGEIWYGDTGGKASPLQYGRSTLSSAIYYKDSVYNALKNKTQRAELAKIAVENGLIDDAKHKAAPYLALFTYYGILNRKNDLFSYDNGSKAYLSREQADLMLGRFMSSETYFEAGKTMKKFPHYYTKAMLIGDGEKAVTAKEWKASMTRLEFIYMLTDSYFPSDVQEARADGNSKDAAKLFKDIDNKDYITDSWKKANKLSNAKPNDVRRKAIKDGVLSNEMDAHIQAAYKLGVLSKDSKGNANLFDNVNYSEAVIMLINAAIGQADGKAL